MDSNEYISTSCHLETGSRTFALLEVELDPSKKWQTDSNATSLHSVALAILIRYGDRV